MLVAVALEVAWEIIENTNPIINQFREVAIWRGYYGDSILNSVGDIIAMTLGFVAAYRFSVLASIVVIVAIEITVALVVHDSLIIGTIMFFHQVDFISVWQASAG